jgi:hypothetical protein
MIIQNAVSCNGCGDFIVSMHRHDYVTCTCGAIAIDGGQDYLRRVGSLEPGSYVDYSWELSDEIYFACAEAVSDAIDTSRNKFGIANAVIRKLREYDRIHIDHEQRIMAHNPSLNEVMVVEADGTINRYKKVM